MSSDQYRDLWATIASGKQWRGEFHNRKKSGEIYWEAASISPIRDQHGKITHFLAIKEDITERKQTKEALRKSQKRFQLIVAAANDGIWDWDLLTDRIYYSPRWKEMLGLSHMEIRDHSDEWFSRIASADLNQFNADLALHLKGVTEQLECEIGMSHDDGTIRWMLCRGAAVRDEMGKPVRLVGSLTDITRTKEAQEALRHDAQHDRLTDLPNLMLFNDRVDQSVYRSKRDPDFKFAILFLDFDRFKLINDSLGHKVGDALLVSIADRFRIHIRNVDTAARFGVMSSSFCSTESTVWTKPRRYAGDFLTPWLNRTISKGRRSSLPPASGSCPATSATKAPRRSSATPMPRSIL